MKKLGVLVIFLFLGPFIDGMEESSIRVLDDATVSSLHAGIALFGVSWLRTDEAHKMMYNWTKRGIAPDEAMQDSNVRFFMRQELSSISTEEWINSPDYLQRLILEKIKELGVLAWDSPQEALAMTQKSAQDPKRICYLEIVRSKLLIEEFVRATQGSRVMRRLRLLLDNYYSPASPFLAVAMNRSFILNVYRLGLLLRIERTGGVVTPQDFFSKIELQVLIEKYLQADAKEFTTDFLRNYGELLSSEDRALCQKVLTADNRSLLQELNNDITADMKKRISLLIALGETYETLNLRTYEMSLIERERDESAQGVVTV